VFEVRAALEGFAARLAALRATEAELEGIRAIHQTYIDTVRYEIVHPITTEPWGVRRLLVRAPDGSVINVVRHRD